MHHLVEKVFIALVLVLLLPFMAEAQNETHCIPVRNLSEKNLAFKAGESLDYVVHYQWGAINSDVAKATVRLDTLTYNGKEAFHCRVYGRTARFYDVFFKVREDFQGWFTRDGLQPLKFTRYTNEGSYECRNDYRFVRNTSDPHITADLYSSKRGNRVETIPLSDCTFDLISLFFNARNMDMTKVKEGVPYPMTFAIDDDVYNVYFTYKGKEVKKVKNLGKVRCMKFSFTLIAGEIFTGESDMFVWISDDENRIPIQFETDIQIGKVSGYVEAYSGLKYPFKSLIETK